MKNIFLTLALLLTVSFAFAGNRDSIEEKCYQKTCSLTASGVVHSTKYGDFIATVTVKGPCDASLSQKLRNKIASLRESFK